MLFYPLYCDIISLTSLKITQTFHLLLGFAENQIIFWDFKIKNSIWITDGSDNGDSDNRGSTVLVFVITLRLIKQWLYFDEINCRVENWFQ